MTLQRRMIVFLSVSTLILFSCASNQPISKIAYYSHPQHGVVALPNEFFTSDRERCKQDVYSMGVEVRGQPEIEVSVIDDYITDAFVWYAKKIHSMRSSKRAAAIGYSAGMRVSGINVPVMLPGDYGLENPEIPAEYSDALRAYADVNRCMSSRGWRRENQGEKLE